MLCQYYDAGTCVSCAQLPVPYEWQIAQAQAECRALLPAVAQWHAPVESQPFHFRNKAKLAIGGTTERPTLGILDGARHGVDLRHCPLHTHGIEAAIPTFGEFIARAGLVPYDVPSRSGELKFVIVTESPDGELMVRFVLRSPQHVPAIEKHLPWLTAQLPHLAVVSVNLHPEHRAVLEGETEIVLTERTTLPMRLGDLTLHLHPRSFFQTNTAVAQALYHQAREWLDGETGTIWDLYCGVGGFALHLAQPRSPDHSRKAEGEHPSHVILREARRPKSQKPGSGHSLDPSVPDPATALRSAQDDARGGSRDHVYGDAPAREIVGVEISTDAIISGRRSASEANLDARFIADDAAAWAIAQATQPRVVVVNPPRRGIGQLAQWLEESQIERVLYSSCNPASLARDLRAMPSLIPVRGRLFDMFPHTPHNEVMVDLRRA